MKQMSRAVEIVLGGCDHRRADGGFDADRFGHPIASVGDLSRNGQATGEDFNLEISNGGCSLTVFT